MRKKVLPFPAPPQQVDAPIACHHSRVNVRVGTQHYAIDTTAQATILAEDLLHLYRVMLNDGVYENRRYFPSKPAS